MPGQASWSELDAKTLEQMAQGNMREALIGKSDLFDKNEEHVPEMVLDKWNAEMFDRVRPRYWKDPGSANALESDSEASQVAPLKTSATLQYDMVVIGGGAAGMVTAAAASIYGAKACMIERNVVGGDCLYTGCVPSKAFLKATKVFHSASNGESFGVETTVKLNFAKLMERMRQIRAEISHADAAEKF